MKRFLKYIAAGLVAGFIAAAIAGCGGNNSSKVMTTTTTATQTQTAAPTTTAAPTATTPSNSAAILNALGPAYVAKFCALRTQGLAQGYTDAQIEAPFAQGYNQSIAAAGSSGQAPDAQTVYNALVGACVSQPGQSA